MKKLFALFVFALAGTVGSAQSQHSVAVMNYTTVSQNLLGSLGMPMPIAGPQIQVWISESSSAPAGYRITLTYTDENGATKSTQPVLKIADAPLPDGTTTTVAIFKLDRATFVIAKVEPVPESAFGQPY